MMKLLVAVVLGFAFFVSFSEARRVRHVCFGRASPRGWKACKKGCGHLKKCSRIMDLNLRRCRFVKGSRPIVFANLDANGGHSHWLTIGTQGIYRASKSRPRNQFARIYAVNQPWNKGRRCQNSQWRKWSVNWVAVGAYCRSNPCRRKSSGTARYGRVRFHCYKRRSYIKVNPRKNYVKDGGYKNTKGAYRFTSFSRYLVRWDGYCRPYIKTGKRGVEHGIGKNWKKYPDLRFSKQRVIGRYPRTRKAHTNRNNRHFPGCASSCRRPRDTVGRARVSLKGTGFLIVRHQRYRADGWAFSRGSKRTYPRRLPRRARGYYGVLLKGGGYCGWFGALNGRLYLRFGGRVSKPKPKPNNSYAGK